MPIHEALAYAERCRGEGRLTRGRGGLPSRARGAAEPAEAEHLLGLIAHQNGKLARSDRARAARDRAGAAGRAVSRQSRRDAPAGRPAASSRSKRRGARSTIEPNMPAALSNLGVALYELKDYEEAARRAPPGDRRQTRFRRGAQQSRQRAACAAALRRGDRRLSPRHRAEAEFCRRLGQSRHHAAPRRRLRGGHRDACAAPSRSRRTTPMPIPGSAFSC